MGLLDIVPGMGTVKTVAGVAVGGVIGYFSGRYSAFNQLQTLKNQYATLEDEVTDLRKRLGSVDEVRLRRTLLKVAILRQLAWKDDTLKSREQLLLYNFILHHPDLPTDCKIQVMREITKKPSAVEQFWQYIDLNYRSQLYNNEEEKLGFKAVLLQLANADQKFNKSEFDFINTVLKSCGLSAL